MDFEMEWHDTMEWKKKNTTKYMGKQTTFKREICVCKKGDVKKFKRTDKRRDN